MIKYKEFDVVCTCGKPAKLGGNGKFWGYLEYNHAINQREQHFICNSCIEKWREDNTIIGKIEFAKSDLGITFTAKTKKGTSTYRATNILGSLGNIDMNVPSEFWDEVNDQYKIWKATEQQRHQESQQMRLKYCDFFRDDFEKWFNAEDFSGNKYEHIVYVWKDGRVILKNDSIPEIILSQVADKIKELTR